VGRESDSPLGGGRCPDCPYFVPSPARPDSCPHCPHFVPSLRDDIMDAWATVAYLLDDPSFFQIVEISRRSLLDAIRRLLIFCVGDFSMGF
jgi:hypothetical protein